MQEGNATEMVNKEMPQFTTIQKQVVINLNKSFVSSKKQIEQNMIIYNKKISKLYDKIDSLQQELTNKNQEINTALVNIEKTILEFTNGYSYADIFETEKPREFYPLTDENVSAIPNAIDISMTEIQKESTNENNEYVTDNNNL